jgi:hypothetical protein
VLSQSEQQASKGEIFYFIHGTESDDEQTTLSNVAVDTMFLLIKPLGELLTRMPVGPDVPGKMAGPSFEVYRAGNILPHRYGAWSILHERLLELQRIVIGSSGSPLRRKNSPPSVRTCAGSPPHLSSLSMRWRLTRIKYSEECVLTIYGSTNNRRLNITGYKTVLPPSANNCIDGIRTCYNFIGQNLPGGQS